MDQYDDINPPPQIPDMTRFQIFFLVTDLMGVAAAVEAAVELLVVPNLSCRRRTSRGGLATELTYAILTCRSARQRETTLKIPTL